MDNISIFNKFLGELTPAEFESTGKQIQHVISLLEARKKKTAADGEQVDLFTANEPATPTTPVDPQWTELGNLLKSCVSDLDQVALSDTIDVLLRKLPSVGDQSIVSYFTSVMNEIKPLEINSKNDADANIKYHINSMCDIFRSELNKMATELASEPVIEPAPVEPVTVTRPSEPAETPKPATEFQFGDGTFNPQGITLPTSSIHTDLSKARTELSDAVKTLSLVKDTELADAVNKFNELQKKANASADAIAKAEELVAQKTDAVAKAEELVAQKRANLQELRDASQAPSSADHYEGSRIGDTARIADNKRTYVPEDEVTICENNVKRIATKYNRLKNAVIVAHQTGDTKFDYAKNHRDMQEAKKEYQNALSQLEKAKQAKNDKFNDELKAKRISDEESARQRAEQERIEQEEFQKQSALRKAAQEQEEAEHTAYVADLIKAMGIKSGDPNISKGDFSSITYKDIPRYKTNLTRTNDVVSLGTCKQTVADQMEIINKAINKNAQAIGQLQINTFQTRKATGTLTIDDVNRAISLIPNGTQLFEAAEYDGYVYANLKLNNGNLKICADGSYSKIPLPVAYSILGGALHFEYEDGTSEITTSRQLNSLTDNDIPVSDGVKNSEFLKGMNTYGGASKFINKSDDPAIKQFYDKAQEYGDDADPRIASGATIDYISTVALEKKKMHLVDNRPGKPVRWDVTIDFDLGSKSITVSSADGASTTIPLDEICKRSAKSFETFDLAINQKIVNTAFAMMIQMFIAKVTK